MVLSDIGRLSRLFYHHVASLLLRITIVCATAFCVCVVRGGGGSHRVPTTKKGGVLQ